MAPPLQPVQARFLTGSLFRHVSVMALTSSVGLMAIFAAELVNMLFIALLGRAELAAAIGYAGAVLFFTTAFGIGLAIAVGALVARAVGAGDLGLAREKASHGLVLSVLFGMGFAALVWGFIPQLVALLGAEGETARLAARYLAILVPSQPLLMVGMIGGAILRSHGDAKGAMNATLVSAFVNAALDPLFIFGLGLGLDGAAFASFLSRVAMAAVALQPIFRRHGGLFWPKAAALGGDLRPVLAIAAPAILTQLATPVGQAFITRAVSGYGEAAVAGMAIVGRLIPVAFGTILALSGAIGPIIGQNAGAGRYDRVRRAFWDGLFFTALVTLAVSALLFLLRAPIADAFQAEGATRALVYLFCGPLSLMWFFNGVLFVANAACNNLKAPLQSTVLNWGRHTLGTLPLALWLGGHYGAAGVLWGQALGGVLFGLIAVWGALRVISRAAAAPLPAPPAKG